MRKLFENWLRAQPHVLNVGYNPKTGKYVLPEDETAWQAFQFALSLSASASTAKPSTCCPGENLVPMHSTDTKLCTGCKTEKHWPLEPGQKRTYE